MFGQHHERAYPDGRAILGAVEYLAARLAAIPGTVVSDVRACLELTDVVWTDQ